MGVNPLIHVVRQGARRLARRETPPASGESLDFLPPLLRRIYAARGVASQTDLDYRLQTLANPQTLFGVEQAAALLARMIQQQAKIVIVGDFDADGATSTAVAMRGLRMLGAQQLDYLVPSRFSDGYGLTPGIVARLLQSPQKPDLLITVDNGIAAIAGVAAAKAAGMRVLVTDHHLPGEQLPDADVIVNPNQTACGFASKAAAGVGVIFYVLMALRQQLRQAGKWPAGSEPNLAQLLDLVALGTVADVVPLDHNNRVLVAQGLRRIRQGEACPGILALLQAAGRDPARVTAADLGFAVGPRLNAAGRLTDMSQGIECLLCDDPASASLLAAGLDRLNRDRRTIEADMQVQAQDHLDRLSLATEGLPWGLALFDPEWHQGVIGILASRLREQTHRPVIAFAVAEDETCVKGSARSIPGLHLRDLLADIDAGHPGLIKSFGGHAMAAGLTLQRDDFAVFAACFDQQARLRLTADQLAETLWSDGALSDDELNLETARLIEQAGPWGQAFPEPVFDGEFQVINQRALNGKHLKLLVQSAQGDALYDAIAFNLADKVDGDLTGRQVRLVYKPQVNHFRGQTQLQLLVDHFL